MPRLPNKLPPGQVADGVTADSWNGLIEAVEVALNIVGGPGVIVRQTGAGTIITLASAENGPFRCIVTAVDQGASVTVDGESIPSEVFYTVRIPERPDMEPIPGLQPTIGRPFQQDQALVFAAQVGAPGVIWREKVDPLSGAEYAWRLSLQETIPLEEDCEEPAP